MCIPASKGIPELYPPVPIITLQIKPPVKLIQLDFGRHHFLVMMLIVQEFVVVPQLEITVMFVVVLTKTKIVRGSVLVPLW